MKASEVVEKLNELIKKHGNLNCEYEDYYEALEVEKVYYNELYKVFRIT